MAGLQLPPGPPGKLLIGNTLDIPKNKEWETYYKWAKEYGESKRDAESPIRDDWNN